MAEQPRSTDAVYAAAPTVRIDGQEYPKVTELMLALEMTEQEGGMSALELRMSNVASLDDNTSDLAFEDDSILKLGAQITIYSGDRNAPQEIFRGKITGLEAEFPETQAPELVVLAEDVFQQARMARRTKVWQNFVDLRHCKFGREPIESAAGHHRTDGQLSGARAVQRKRSRVLAPASDAP